MGSVAAFLVLEASEHAEARGKKPYARLGPVLSDRSMRRPGEAAANAERQFDTIRKAAHHRPVAVLSGATGIAAATREERDFLTRLIEAGDVDTVRAVANHIGSSVEAAFAAEVALAALALSRGGFFPPGDDSGFEKPAASPPKSIVVTTWGVWRGEGMGLVEAVE
jgi:3-oxoacyl-[acyl-carrier-protein] synthase II